MCLLYHWRLPDCLSMNALDFFIMLREGREHEERQRAMFMYELTFISAIPSLTVESATNVRQMFEKRTITKEQEEENREFVERVKAHTESLKKPLDGENAKRAMFNVFAMKRRSQYGR